jgi:hypothetical protein
MNKYKHLTEYISSYKANGGASEKPPYLPKLVVYFREALEDTVENIPDFFGWDDETAEDFFTWGRNSRWAHTFNRMLGEHLPEYVDLLVDFMEETGTKDIEIKYPGGDL